MLLYLTFWFKQDQQAQAVGLFLTALPAANIIGGPLSGWILDHAHWLGLMSWRWLFILEALPAIALGFFVWRKLPDRPAQAAFLTAHEKEWVDDELSREAAAKPGTASVSVARVLRHPRVWYLAACAFLFNIGTYLSGFWLPQAIKAVALSLSNTQVGFLVMVPNLVGLGAMVLVARSSDRRSERRYHVALPLCAAAAALILLSTGPSVFVTVALWCVVCSGIYSVFGPFWAMAGGFLSGRSVACSFALINSIGNLGGFVGLTSVGTIATRTGSLSGGFRFVATALLLSAALILSLRRADSRASRCAPNVAHVT